MDVQGLRSILYKIDHHFWAMSVIFLFLFCSFVGILVASANKNITDLAQK